MPQIVNNCPLCAISKNLPFDRREFRGSLVENRICVVCGLVFQSPRLTDEEMNVYYQAEYRRTYQGTEGPTDHDLAVQTARAQSLVRFFHPYVSNMDRFLDIGCSAGMILQQVKNQFCCKVVGIEPGDAYRTYAQDLGLTIYPSLDEMEHAGEKRFSMISMAHVLEHLPDPVGYLIHLRENLIEPGGWLLVEVPNLYAHDSFEAAHLVAYSQHTLLQTIGKAGFNPVHMETHGRPRSDILPLYITVLVHPVSCTPSPWQPVPERRVALKRRLGMLRRMFLERLFPKQAWRNL